MGRMSKPPYQQRCHHLKWKQVYLLKVLPCCLCKVWMNLISFLVFPDVFLSPRRPCSSVSALLFVSVLVFRTFIVFFLFVLLWYLLLFCALDSFLSPSVSCPSICLPSTSPHVPRLFFVLSSTFLLFCFFYLICFKAHLLVSKPSTHITEPYPIDFSAL